MIEINTLLLIALRFLDLFPGLSSMALSYYLHPNSIVDSEINYTIFDEGVAAWAAVIHLINTDVSNIQICEVMKIELRYLHI